MTTYTLTERQRKVLLDMGKFAYNACHSDFVMDEKIMPAMALLEELQPNTQEPEAEAEAYALADKVRTDLDRMSCPGVYMNITWESVVKSYRESTRPAPRQPQQPRELTNDDLWTVWDDYYSDTASYDRQSFDVVFLRAVLEAAHNIGVKP